jgi:CRP-like cAMP-binding protein
MTIPFPIRDVRLRHETPPDDSVVRERTKAALAAHPVLGALDDEALDKVAANARVVAYAPGERVVRQGAPGNSMYLIQAGRLRIEAVPEGGQEPVQLSTRGAGDFFGEMSLLTGEPRTASVVAETDAELLRVDKAAVAEVILAHPEAAALLSKALAERAAESQALISERTRGRRSRTDDDLRAQILQRIVAFFAEK